MMQVRSNWRRFLRKAWSVRLMLVASILSGCNAVLPYASDFMSRGTFAGVSFLIVTGALLSQFIVQKDMQDDN